MNKKTSRMNSGQIHYAMRSPIPSNHIAMTRRIRKIDTAEPLIVSFLQHLPNGKSFFFSKLQAQLTRHDNRSAVDLQMAELPDQGRAEDAF